MEPMRERQRLPPPQPVPPSSSEEALQQAQAEGLVLRVADNKTGYFGVRLDKPGKPKPYQAQVWRCGKKVSLGNFAAACPSGDRATHSAASSAVAKQPRYTCLPPRITRA